MRVRELDPAELERRLRRRRLYLRVGPFRLRLGARDSEFTRTLARLHADTSLVEDAERELIDFHLALERPAGLRRWWRPTVHFHTDATPPFAPFPREHAFALFEWGLNWCVAMQAHQYLMFHSAVLAKGERALVMPAEPGSGKSTLCAALMLRGWRLLSDEFGLYHPERRRFDPIPRPIPLKNASIEVIRRFDPTAVLGPVYEGTRKGDVAHLRPTSESLEAVDRPAAPSWIVFPRYRAGAREALHPFAKGRTFLKLTGNAFNYRLQGARGFDAVVEIVERCNAYYLEFGDLERAVSLLDGLAETA